MINVLIPPPPERYDLRDQTDLRRTLDTVFRTLDPLTNGLYTPVITSSGGGETLTYGTQLGQWFRLGALTWFAADMTLATKAGGAGDIQVSLPAAAGNTLTQVITAYVDVMGATFVGAPLARIFNLGTTVRIRELVAGSGAAAWAKLGATSIIRVTGMYQTA